ncbi:MAG: c-type cytochrome [Phycisphaerales bacterium]|nr:c-type cytochrome [Phycisphaerales bacterium]
MTATKQNAKARTPEDPARRDPGPGRVDDGLRQFGLAVVVGLLLMAPMLGIGGQAVYKTWRVQHDARRAAYELSQAHERLIAAAAGPKVSVDDAVHGREIFSSACAACHGPDGKGMTGLGKNLLESDFVASKDDDQLREFLIVGRPDAKPVAMPPKGGRDDLTDNDLRHVVTYLRGLQDARRMPELPAMVVNKAPSEEQKAAALAAAGGDAELAGYIASGDKLFHSTCVACHGKAGVGMQGNGKALVKNDFVKSLDDDGLLAFIKQGRGPTDPKNTTGIQMPPKGGNPALSDDDILDIISYLRTLQGERSNTNGTK